MELLTSKLSETSVVDNLANDNGQSVSFLKMSLKLDTTETAEPILEKLRSMPHVNKLVLEGNTMGIPAAEAIGKQLENHMNLKELCWADMFTGRLKSEIPSCLISLTNGIIKANAQITSLDLSDNAFGPNGMNGLANFLRSSSCFSLKELKLHNNGLGPTGGKMLADALNDCYDLSCKAGQPLGITTFISGRGRLENEGSKALSKVFKKMKSLVRLEMPQNGINFEGIIEIADSLKSNSNLKHLNMNDNTFTEKGAKAMADVLPTLKKLQTLNFGDCLIRDDGAMAIAEALAKQKSSELKEVCFSFDELNLKSGIYLLESLINIETIEKIDLDGNGFGDEGCEQLHGICEDAGKSGILTEMENDEGDNEDDDDDYDNEDYEDEEVSNEDIDVSLQTLQIKDLLLFPSPSKLKHPNAPEQFMEELGDKKDNINDSLKYLVKLCCVITDADLADESIKSHAIKCADNILEHLFIIGKNNKSEIISAILIYSGLLKSEDKIERPLNITGFLIVLQHIVKQAYFPRDSLDILTVFLSRENKLLETSNKARNELLNTLKTLKV